MQNFAFEIHWPEEKLHMPAIYFSTSRDCSTIYFPLSVNRECRLDLPGELGLTLSPSTLTVESLGVYSEE
jgi:hypothetical protein